MEQDGNIYARCDACINLRKNGGINCADAVYHANYVCSKFTPQLYVTGKTEAGKLYVQFHNQINASSSPWIITENTPDVDLWKAAETLRVRVKDVFTARNNFLYSNQKTVAAYTQPIGKPRKTNENNDEEAEVIHIHTPGLYIPEMGLCFEQIEGEKYLLNNGEIVAYIPNGANCKYIPLPKDQVNWNLCTKTSVTPVDKKKLWRFVRAFLYKSVELPDDRLYDVLTAWVFATWVSELWGTVPYIFFLGPKNSGKTRGLEALQMLSFRGKFSISSTPAALYRSIEKYGVIPFLDEAEVYNQEQKGDVIACLNAGYKRRSGKIERCKGDNNDEIVNFNVFGFKVIAGTESMKATLESRSIIINMAKNTRHIDIIINDRAAQEIRNKLLVWRFETLIGNKIAPQRLLHEALESNEYDEYDEYDEFDAKTKALLDIPEELRAIRNSRVIELFAPLTAVTDSPEREIIVEYAKTVASQQKTEENTSLEADLVLAILSCSSSITNGAIANNVIEAAYNEGRPLKEQLYGKTLTSKIAALGFERCRVGKKRGFSWNTKLLRRLCERFGFDPDNFVSDVPSPLIDSSYSSNSSESSNSSTQLQRIDYSKVASCTVIPSEERKFNQICPICQEKRDLPWNLKFFDGTQAAVCNQCGSRCLEAQKQKEENEHEY